jgi:ABC-type sulfate transport system permease subunit
MKYIFQMAYLLIFISWAYCLIQYIVIENNDIQMLFAVKMIVYSTIMVLLNFTERWFNN